MANKVISFEGTLCIEGTPEALKKLDMGELRNYLESAICLDIDHEGHGSGPSDDIQVTGIGLDWDSLK